MSNQINIKSLKKRKLIELLLKTGDKRRSHFLYLTSCYFTLKSARILINEINDAVHLDEVLIYIDRKTALAIGKNKLTSFCNSFRKVVVKLYAVDASNLFHSKSYALISYSDDGYISCGSLVVGSANLTGQGLVNRTGNIESLLDTQDDELIFQFTEQLDNLKILSVKDIENFTSSDEYNFKYALLNEGFFIHKWLDNLGQYLSVKFNLNENGMRRIGDDSFRNAGFNIESASISKRYFKFSYEPPHLKNTENITRNYGIETYLGYWIPSSALETIFEKTEFDNFCSELKKQFKIQIDNITKSISKDLDYLKSENIIHVSDSDPIDIFNSKFDGLLNNELKLKRIYSKFEIFNLPYDINNQKEIENLFDEMVSLSESKERKNTAMKAFLSSISSASIVGFRDKISKSLEN